MVCPPTPSPSSPARQAPGKTILSQHFAFTNATPQRPALYCSTVSEPLDKLLRYGQTLTMFDVGVVGTSVLYEDLGAVAIGPGGLEAVMVRLDVLLNEHRPSVIVIDSFKALRPFATDLAAYRTFLHNLAGRLSARGRSRRFCWASTRPMNWASHRSSPSPT